MVDGIDVGSEVVLYERRRCKNNCDFEKDKCSDCQGSFAVQEQDFSNADMITVQGKSYGTAYGEQEDVVHKDGDKVKNHLFVAYGIFGNKIITAPISGTKIRALKDKGIIITWAKKKPYILNGVRL